VHIQGTGRQHLHDQLSLKAMLWTASAGFFMQTLDTTIVNTALPAIAIGLGVTMGAALVGSFAHAWPGPAFSFRMTFLLTGVVVMLSAAAFASFK